MFANINQVYVREHGMFANMTDLVGVEKFWESAESCENPKTFFSLGFQPQNQMLRERNMAFVVTKQNAPEFEYLHKN